MISDVEVQSLLLSSRTDGARRTGRHASGEDVYIKMEYEARHRAAAIPVGSSVISILDNMRALRYGRPKQSQAQFRIRDERES